MLVESQKREWDERIARLDQRDRLTWEAMIMGMTRLGIAQYVGDIYLTVAPTAWRGNDCVRRLCHDVNREIAREMGEAV